MLTISVFLRCLCLVAVAVALASCADSRAKPDVRAHENKNKMVALKPDMTTEQVTNLMGPPDKIVMQRGKNNVAVVTYLYITQYVETYTSRGWDRDNYTPFIFVNDRLTGWSWHHLDTAAERYGFDIKTIPFLAPGP